LCVETQAFMMDGLGRDLQPLIITFHLDLFRERLNLKRNDLIIIRMRNVGKLASFYNYFRVALVVC